MLLILMPGPAMAGHASLFDLKGDPEDYFIRIQPRVWFAQNDAFDMKMKERITTSVEAVLEWDAGLDDQVRFVPFVELKLAKRHKLRFDLFIISQNETIGPGDVKITIGGVTLPSINVPGILLSGEIDLDVYEFGYQYDLFHVWGGYIGPLIDIALTNYQLKDTLMFDPDRNGTPDIFSVEDDEGIVVVPQIGIGWRVYPHRRVAIFGEVKGMSIGEDATVVQALGGVEFQLRKNLAFEAGFRYFYLYLGTITDIDIIYEDSGPFVGTVFRF